jgi:hypothetical protein
MKLPSLTPIQFVVLEAIAFALLPGKELRARLHEKGIPMEGPNFYQCMKRMEKSRLVRVEKRSQIITGQIIKESLYAVTKKGECAFLDAVEFYGSGKQSPLWRDSKEHI